MKGLVLLIIAYCLAFVLLPIGFAYELIVTLFKYSNIYLFRVALSIDQLGNTVCQSLFNDLLIKNNTIYPFGFPDETISSVLGKNKTINNLTFLGRLLTWFLNLIDKNHVEKAIERNVYIKSNPKSN